ncbi:MAG TPA: hypothetical protein GXZ50_10205 [Clostridia bacterium]|nr:hypothetical protein [Clostridia bacterium]
MPKINRQEVPHLPMEMFGYGSAKFIQDKVVGFVKVFFTGRVKIQG